METRSPAEQHGKHADMIIRQDAPFNAEPPPDRLRDSFVTPLDLFFVRNHGMVPVISPAEYCLRVDGLVERPLSLSLEELRRDFPFTLLAATLQCAGNRRQELIDVGEVPGETPWGAQAISHGVWGGVRLRDVLQAAGVEAAAQHVAFLGLDSTSKAGGMGLGGSLPLDKALQPEVLLAYEMNGELLPPTHGFPLRVVVPGYIGARSVKWLGAITLQTQPSDNYFQARAYKLFPPEATPETADWEAAPMLGDLALSAVICRPLPNAAFTAGPVSVQGYAIVGAGREVARVEISVDNGRTWVEAALQERAGPWSWCFWEATLELAPGQYELCVRAWDSAGTTQPADLREVWNFKGYMNNAWHRVAVEVRG